MVIKRIFLFIFVVLLINPFANAAVNNYGYGGGGGINEVSRPDENQPGSRIFFRIGDQGYFKNKGPTVTPNYPSNLWVVSGHSVEFSWSYSDAEDDEILGYNLEISDDPRFISTLSYYGLSETNRKIYILEGDKDYYWRVRARDAFGWGEFSHFEEFYVDLTKKACDDGTLYFQCSTTNFQYCDAGELKEDCQTCGCPLNSECTISGACVERTCLDGTRYGFCSNKKPTFCQNGELKEVCSICGCLAGQECNADGTCSTKVRELPKEETISEGTFLSGFFSFIKSLFKF